MSLVHLWDVSKQLPDQRRPGGGAATGPRALPYSLGRPGTGSGRFCTSQAQAFIAARL